MESRMNKDRSKRIAELIAGVLELIGKLSFYILLTGISKIILERSGFIEVFGIEFVVYIGAFVIFMKLKDRIF